MKKRKPTKIPVHNLEFDLPTLDEARKRLIEIIEREKKEGTKVFKIIHGYGSSGTGGKLRIGLRRSLRKRIKEKKISDFIPGEEFNLYSERTRHFLDEIPNLKYEQDFNRNNHGITIIILRIT